MGVKLSIFYEVFGRDGCNDCTSAKNLLTEKGLNFSYYNIEQDAYALKVFKDVFKGKTTVPQIAWKDIDNYEIIGNYSDLVRYLNERI